MRERPSRDQFQASWLSAKRMEHLGEDLATGYRLGKSNELGIANFHSNLLYPNPARNTAETIQ